MASRLVLRIVFPPGPEAQSAPQASEAVDSEIPREDGPESSQEDGSDTAQPSGSLPSEHNSSQPLFGQDPKDSNAEESTGHSDVTSDEPPKAAEQERSTEECSSSHVAHPRPDEISDETDNTYTHNENEEEDWVDGGDGGNDEDGEDDDDDDDYDDEDGQPRRNMWLSETEKVRVAFKRLRRTAEKRGFDRSPFLPTTAAEYVGLKADMFDAEAARLRAKIDERKRERELHAQVNAQRTVFHYGAPEQGEPDPLAHLRWHPVPNFPHPAAGYMFPATPWPYNFPFMPSFIPSTPTSTLNPAAEPWSPPLQSPASDTNANACGYAPGGCTLALSLLPAQPRRATSIPLLRDLASHATLRRGIVQDETEENHTNRNFRWFRDDDESSNASSFTPCDYRPGNQSIKCEYIDEDVSDELDSEDYLADNEHNTFPSDSEDEPAWSDSSFTPTLYRTKPSAKGQGGGSSSRANHPAAPVPPSGRRLPLATLPLSHNDGLSPVLALPSPFNPSAALNPDCDWPSYAEYTSEGDARVKQRTPKVNVAITVTSPNGTTTTTELAQGPVYPHTQSHGHHHHQQQQQHNHNDCSLGRFLPVPRLRAVIDPRLGLTADEVACYVAYEGSGRIPWEMRAMVPERWDFHRERRVSEAWDRGYAGARAWGDWAFWEMAEEEHGGELAGLRIVRELLGDGTYAYHDADAVQEVERQ